MATVDFKGVGEPRECGNRGQSRTHHPPTPVPPGKVDERLSQERQAQKWEHDGTSRPLHTRQPAGGGPWEQGQQQEHGTQHAGLAAVSVQEPEAAASAQAAPRASRWAGGPVLGWTATPGGRERGWQTSEPLPKACQGLRAPLPLDLCLFGGCPSKLPDIGQVATNTTSPNPASVSPQCRVLIQGNGTAPPAPNP